MTTRKTIFRYKLIGFDSKNIQKTIKGIATNKDFESYFKYFVCYNCVFDHKNKTITKIN